MQFEVAIVGASLAGAVTARTLGLQGIRTILIDKANFPRRKPCGEGLSVRGLAFLEDLGLSEEIKKLPHHQFNGYSVWIGATRVDLPGSGRAKNASRGIGVAREQLDQLVLNSAIDTGFVRAVLGTQVRSVQEISAGYLLDLGSEVVTTKFLVLADGSNSFLAPRLGIPERTVRPGRFGVSIELVGEYSERLTGVHVLVEKGFEVCCTPISNTAMNISILTNKERIPQILKTEWQAELLAKIAKRTGFSGQITGEILAVGPLGRIRRPSFKGRILLAGDVAESLDPIGGMGMTHAIGSGVLAAAALTKVLQCQTTLEFALTGYAREREALIRSLRGFTQLTYLTLKKLPHPRLVQGLLGSRLARCVGDIANGHSGGPRIQTAFCQSIITLAGVL